MKQRVLTSVKVLRYETKDQLQTLQDIFGLYATARGDVNPEFFAFFLVVLLV